MHSLHGRLVGTLLGIFICAWTIVGIYMYVQFAQTRSGSMDHALDEVANTVLLSMPSDINHLSARSNLSLKSGVSNRVEKFGRLIQVWSKGRREILLRSAGAFATPLKPDFADGFGTVQLNGRQWRVYAITDARNEVQVQVGIPMSDLIDDLRAGLYYALGVSLLALLVVAVAVKLVVRWSLKPVVTIQSAITSREALDLTPLPSADLPFEVRPLIDSFNRLLGRLEHAMQTERRFLMEAAHELRTPLAVLLGHAQVAQRAETLEEARPALEHLVRGVERSARLSQQLLHSARIERQAEDRLPIELGEIVAVLVRDFEMMATQNRQSITLHVEPGVIRGNVDELGILVSNLLDNALRYAGHGCRVTVRCVRDANSMRLEVLDDGPGVEEADRGRIFDRFYRGAGVVEGGSNIGSGIGLALVARIAQSHGAAIHTGSGFDGRGFGITISFPVLAEAELISDAHRDHVQAQPASGALILY